MNAGDAVPEPAGMRCAASLGPCSRGALLLDDTRANLTDHGPARSGLGRSQIMIEAMITVAW
jgi:hypothetical protein